MKSRVYLETTIPSYLTAWPSRDLVRAAHQQMTRDWWEKRRSAFELYISQVVVQECQAGDASAAAERLKALQDPALAGADRSCRRVRTDACGSSAVARAGRSRCPACGHCGSPWDGLSADLELHTYCQCNIARANRVRLPFQRLRAANDLHTR